MAFSVLVLHGPNLSLLAKEQIDPLLEAHASKRGIQLRTSQANGEEGLLDALHAAVGKIDAVVVNPCLLAPHALSLAEGLKQVGVPAVEVLLWAQQGPSALSGVVLEQIHGLGIEGYVRALEVVAPGSAKKKVEVAATGRVGKSIGRKRSPTPVRTTIAAGAILTRAQVRERIKRRLKGQESPETLAKWARETWTALQRGSPCEEAAKDNIENVLLTLMAGVKVTEHTLVTQMAKLDL